MPINFDNMIHLDAEDLAEGGIGEAYRLLMPELACYVPTPAPIEEVIDDESPRYAIRVLGQELVIYSPDAPESSNSWVTATYVLFKIVNDQLAASGIRFYAFSSGNDLGGMFLSPKAVEESRESLWADQLPYIPTLQAP